MFCHYIATGRALRQHISEAIRREIERIGIDKRRDSDVELFGYLDQLGKKFFDADTSIRKYCDEYIHELLEKYRELKENGEKITDIVRRYIRTPSFLVRYFPLDEKKMDKDAVHNAFSAMDKSGLALRDVIDNFFQFLTTRCGDEERWSYIQALDAIQTGSIAGRDVIATYSEDELEQGSRLRTERLLPNVRLANGITRADTRQKLMLTFNTPFFPEILIASSVMAEGVDLHLNCRHVIHHDLCWNPSTLEQRTGRVDRIGAKIQRCGNPLRIYLPFIAETQDEKMYRVVMDRERWFKVVMGEKIKMDARSTDKLASRVPLPEAAAVDLMFKLNVEEK